MKISQEVRDFASTQNQGADSFLMSAGADAAEASRKAAEEGMKEMSERFKEEGSEIYLPSD
jgi:phosphomethylpyrimidine synthase